MVYLAKKGDGVVFHTDLEAMRQIDGIEQADLEIDDNEFKKAGGIVRMINGGIVLGKTAEEKQVEQNAARVQVLKRHLADTDYIAVKIAEGSATKNDYAQKIAERQAWREELRTLESA